MTSDSESMIDSFIQCFGIRLKQQRGPHNTFYEKKKRRKKEPRRLRPKNYTVPIVIAHIEVFALTLKNYYANISVVNINCLRKNMYIQVGKLH